MKTLSILQLSIKNLFSNFTSAIYTLICLALLSITIITLGNLSYFYIINCDNNLLSLINATGLDIELTINYENTDSTKTKLEKNEIDRFIYSADSLNNFPQYQFKIKNFDYQTVLGNDTNIFLLPYLRGKIFLEDNPIIVSGEIREEDSAEKGLIWLSNEIAYSKNIKINDMVIINLNGIDIEFIVGAIVDDYYSYIDYSYFNITSVKLFNSNVHYSDLKVINQLKELEKFESDDIKIGGETLGNYYIFKAYKLFVVGICGFLILLCVVFSMGCILNTLKINIEDNNFSLGLMKMLGIRNESMWGFIIFQEIIIILIATIISTFISWLIAKFSLLKQLNILNNVFSFKINNDAIIGFYFIIPIVNFLILSISVILGSIKMLREYFANPPILIISQVI